ncbi:MAG TPA: HPr(Ser) kinase/phosphatase [Gammaproteobacteria bacterium]|nr:HPr(Ser) kinase/phosphatase [Gammaproteobacteria bacterium]
MTPPPLNSGKLFKLLQDKLDWVWQAGREGEERLIRLEEKPGVALVGHLNLIHPSRIQVLGHTELLYLKRLKKNSYHDTLAALFSENPAMVVFADNEVVSEDFRQYASREKTPLISSKVSSHTLIERIRCYLFNWFAAKVTLHGVFMEVIGIGVLLTGDSGIGKSEVAFELLNRGHRLIADDTTEFSRIALDTLSGTCPPVLQDFLEVRGLGVINVREMFGDSAIKQSKYLRLMIHFKQMTDEDLNQIDRLRGSGQQNSILDVDIPQITLPVAPGRSLAVLVEGAVRNHILSYRGYNAAQHFIERQRACIAEG